MLKTVVAGRYEVLREIGRGGMGVVYAARDAVLDREVALKVIADERLDVEVRDRFVREARVVARMDHPAVIGVHDFGEDAGRLFLVMPLVVGQTLRDLLRRGGLRLLDVLRIGEAAAGALAYAHAIGIVHRDIKPENVMIAGEGELLRVRLTDFGLAFVIGEQRLTRTGGLVGTVAYLSPEQIVGTATIEASSDIYALGAMLYECIAGSPPFVGDVATVLYRVVYQPPRPLGEITPIGAELEALVMACISKQPGQRPSASDVASALARSARDMGHGARLEARVTPPLPSPPERPAPAIALLGRDAEMAAIETRLARAMSGECQFIVASGPPGIGKTRILEELARFAESRGARVLSAQFNEQSSAVPYQGFSEIFEDYARGASSSAHPDFSDLIEEISNVFPALADFPVFRAASAASPRSAAPSGERELGAIFELLSRALSRIATDRPLVVLCEELHGARASIEALGVVVRRLSRAPILFAATFVSTEIDRAHPVAAMLETFDGSPRFLHLPLKPLGEAAHKSFVDLLISGEPALVARMTGEALTKLYELSEGNPSFTVELVRAFRESAGDARASMLDAGALAGLDALPPTVQKATLRRLERLKGRPREVLSIASVLGRNFDVRDLEPLAALEGGSSEFDDAIDELTRLGFLVEERGGRGDRLAFASVLVMGALYAELPRRRRRVLHRRAVEIVERRASARGGAARARLFHHYVEGDLADKACELGLELARAALAAQNPEDARRTLEIVLSLAEDEGRAADEAEARFLSGLARRKTGELDAALKDLERASAFWSAKEDSARALEAMIAAAETAWEGRLARETRGWVDKALPLARTSGAPELTSLLTLGATVANLSGDAAGARSYLLEAGELAKAEAPSSPVEKVLGGGCLRVAMGANIATTDPALIERDAEVDVLSNVFETLLATDPSGSLVPRLCDRWEAMSGARTFLFSLRDHAIRHDGRRLTATDVKASFERSIRLRAKILPPAFAPIAGVEAFLSGAAPDVAGIRVIGAKVVGVSLNERIAVYPSFLTDPTTAIACVAESVPVVEPESGSGADAPDDPSSRDDVTIAAESSFAGPAPADEPATRAIEGDVDPETLGFGLAGAIDTASPTATPPLDHAARLFAGLHLIGTGPFSVTRVSTECVTLEPAPHVESRPTLDALEFYGGLRSSAIAEGIRNGSFDLAGGVSAELVDRLLDEAQLGLRLIEAPAKYTALALFRRDGTGGANDHFRRALFGAMPIEALVRRHGGRFTRPAFGIIPPGIFGHDSQRRRRTLSRAEALELLAKGARASASRVVLGVHAPTDELYHGLIDAMVEIWRDLGVTVERRILKIDAIAAGLEADVLIVGWAADYDDPDAITSALFHSKSGFFREWLSSASLDERLDKARAENAQVREGLYRAIEDDLIRSSHVLPILHRTGYRILGPGIHGLTLQSSAPYLNYASAWRTEAVRTERSAARGVVVVAQVGTIDSLDPFKATDAHEVRPKGACFETLMREGAGAEIVPWLASDVRAEAFGRRYRIQLREGVRFHDGRPLTSRDVRWSWEWLLQNGDPGTWFPAAAIVGAAELRARSKTELRGFTIVGPHEFVVELSEPLALFPALLCLTSMAIVPEGTRAIHGTFREGCVGTGPFRVVAFEPNVRLELEANPEYWRAGYPKSKRLVFECGMTSQEVAQRLRAGRCSLTSDFEPGDLEAIARDPSFNHRVFMRSGLSTAALVFNLHSGPFVDEALRQTVARAISAPAIAKTLGRWAVPATSFVAPGLLRRSGVATRPGVPRDPGGNVSPLNLHLRCRVSPGFRGKFQPAAAKVWSILQGLGMHTTVVDAPLDASMDLWLSGWMSDYPDADSFYRVLHSTEGEWALAGSKALDALIIKGRSESDVALRRAIYAEADRVVVERAHLIPLFHAQRVDIIGPDLRGLEAAIHTVDQQIDDSELWVEG